MNAAAAIATEAEQHERHAAADHAIVSTRQQWRAGRAASAPPAAAERRSLARRRTSCATASGGRVRCSVSDQLQQVVTRRRIPRAPDRGRCEREQTPRLRALDGCRPPPDPSGSHRRPSSGSRAHRAAAVDGRSPRPRRDQSPTAAWRHEGQRGRRATLSRTTRATRRPRPRTARAPSSTPRAPPSARRRRTR